MNMLVSAWQAQYKPSTRLARSNHKWQESARLSTCDDHVLVCFQVHLTGICTLHEQVVVRVLESLL